MTLEEVINCEINDISRHITHLDQMDKETEGRYKSISEEITYQMGCRSELYRLRRILWQGEIDGIFKEDCK